MDDGLTPGGGTLRMFRGLNRLIVGLIIAGVIMLLLLILNNMSPSAHGAGPVKLETRNSKLETLLAAIRTVETGNRDLTGDGGQAIGPYQIHRAYWQDAGVPGTYADCHQEAYARSVVLAYWARYAPQALARLNPDDLQTLARIHNGGPRGAANPATLAYWKKVQATL